MNETEKENKRRYLLGRNPVTALLEESPDRCTKVLIAKTVLPHIKTKIIDLCRATNVAFQNVDTPALDRLTNKENHQGVVAYMKLR